MAAADHLIDCSTLADALAHLSAGLIDRRIDWPPCEECEPNQMPEPQRRLLVHRDHMTEALQRFYGSAVTLHVLRRSTEGDVYRREILLRLDADGRVVEYGVVRMNRRAFPDETWREIEAETAPLGEIMIRHDVLRRIEPLRFIRFDLSRRTLAHGFGEPGGCAHGRIGVIHCNGAPAIELLEVVSATQTAH